MAKSLLAQLLREQRLHDDSHRNPRHIPSSTAKLRRKDRAEMDRAILENKDNRRLR